MTAVEFTKWVESSTDSHVLFWLGDFWSKEIEDKSDKFQIQFLSLSSEKDL